MTSAVARPSSESGVAVLVSVVTSAATGLLIVTWSGVAHAVQDKPLAAISLLVLTLAMMLMAVEIYGRGSITVAGVGMLTVGFAFGIGAGMVAAFLAAAVHAARRRSRLHRALFNAATFSLATAAGTGIYQAATADGSSTLAQLGPAAAAGTVFWAVNIGLLTLAMSLAEGLGFLAVWRERFRWVTPYYVAFGPLALACNTAYEKVGLAGLLAFAVPPAFVMFSMQQYLDKTREAIEDVHRANDELQRANAALAARNQDLHELFEFAGGLAAQAHDHDALLEYAQSTLARMAGTDVKIAVGLGEAGGDVLVAGGHPVGSVHVGDSERWERLREALLPQLATALESAELVERIRKTHLETIAALSRSMEAKDYYTGGHTERVATVAVALARRLGFAGTDLDAVEIGALLHDIGKIGIPERILHKPGPLDDDEWKVMKEHPIISEYILSEVELPRIVLEIARSSHERMDGAGYPDGLTGEEIPLPARIVLVADAFDALTSDRPYRRGRRVREALDELRAHTGTQFCPRVIEALEQVYREEPHVLAAGDLRIVGAA